MAAFIDLFMQPVDTMIEVILKPEEGKNYYYTTWTKMLSDRRYFTTNPLSKAGKYLREDEDSSVFLNFQGEEVTVIHSYNLAFYEVTPDTNLSKLKIAEKEEVICNAQENRHYYVTNYTEIIDKGTDQPRYYTSNMVANYVGKYTGSRAEGWGKNFKQWSHFITDGIENIIQHTPTTAFIRLIPEPKPVVVKQNCNKKELAVVRTPLEGKYYEATFWQRREGHWSAEKHYTKETTPREYVGKYLRHKQQGYGDGADHWAIFLRDGKEIEIEYDYDGKRAWYEVEKRD